MENTELKKQNWKKLKKDFFAKVPTRFKVEVEGIEDDSKYYHPIIILDDELLIHCQSDIDSDSIYGYSIQFKTKEKIGNYIYGGSLSVDTDAELTYILNNFNKIRENINNSLVEIIKLESLKNSLSEIQNDMIYHSISKDINKQKLKQNIDSLYSVSEYLENKRIV